MCHAAKVEMTSSDYQLQVVPHVEFILSCLLKNYDVYGTFTMTGHRNLYMYQVSFSTVFFFVRYIHIRVPFITYCSRLFVVVFQEMNSLHTFKYEVVCWVTELHLSAKFHVHQCCS